MLQATNQLRSILTHRITTVELNELAQYNARVNQGIVHTEEYKARISELQKQFDSQFRKPR